MGLSSTLYFPFQWLQAACMARHDVDEIWKRFGKKVLRTPEGWGGTRRTLTSTRFTATDGGSRYPVIVDIACDISLPLIVPQSAAFVAAPPQQQWWYWHGKVMRAHYHRDS